MVEEQNSLTVKDFESNTEAEPLSPTKYSRIKVSFQSMRYIPSHIAALQLLIALAYVDDSLLSSGKISRAAILGQQGRVWGISSGYQLSLQPYSSTLPIH